jgi:hypothetical protein
VYLHSSAQLACTHGSRQPSDPSGYALVVTSLVIAVDPDSSSSAVAWAVRSTDGGFIFGGVDGGGSRAVTWQTITGARAWLDEQRGGVLAVPAQVAVVVETQAPSGPQSADCEELRRVRYHWQAACEVDGYACEFVSAMTWQMTFVPKADHPPRGAGAGAWKKAYQKRAKQLAPSLATNEDRCAAIGMLWWYVVDVLGSTLTFGDVSEPAIASARK